jgi:paraquat-inducible protein A
MNDHAKSLRALHPWRWDVPGLVILTAALLGVSLALPVLKMEKLIFWEDHFSIWSSIVMLHQGGNFILAGIIFVFSMVFPVAKLATLLVLWFASMSPQGRSRWLQVLELLGRWSMLDVYVVAILIVLAKASGVAKAQPQAGLYLFAGAIAGSMLITMYIGRLAGKAAEER